MNYVLNTITFLLLSVNGDVIYLDHKFDPKKYNCETYYESKTTYFEKSNACFILKQNDVISRNDKPFSNIFLSSAISY